MLGNHVAFLLVVNFLHFSTHPKDFYGNSDRKFTRFCEKKKKNLPDFYDMFQQVAKI
jgi:hypothetical protein